MAILLQVQAGEIKLLHSLDFLGAQRSLGGIGDGSHLVGLWFPGQELLAALIADHHPEIRPVGAIDVNNLVEYLFWRQGQALFIHSAFLIVKSNLHLLG